MGSLAGWVQLDARPARAASPVGPVVLWKTITTIRPYFFETAHATHTGGDRVLARQVTSVDLGRMYWNRQLDERLLARMTAADEVDPRDPAARVAHDMDVQAVRDLPRAKAILASFSTTMPDASDLMFCFRVISRCSDIATQHESGFEVHLARGLVCSEYDQYRVADVVAAASEPSATSVGRCLEGLVSDAAPPPTSMAAVINLRNDGELHQAVLLAAIIKRRSPGTVVILDTAGANEQYAFAEWVSTFESNAAALAPYIDYFIPRQDYRATLRALLDSLAAGGRPARSDGGNLVCLAGGPSDAPPMRVPEIEQAFTDYTRALPVFASAGQRTAVGRLAPAKCHWAVCKFCTINSQHLMPRGRSISDVSYRRYFETLARKIEDDRIESLILMDEALHPTVLLGFARWLLSRGISIVYRARCRFTDDLTLDTCRTLYQSGCRYLGMGLESASPRVNRLVSKHMGAPVHYEEVLENLEAAGIRMHVYAIMGFPTETADEILRTRDFLISSIQRFRYLTVSANLFHLMRGSGIAREPEAFGIRRVIERGDASLVLDFEEPERSRNHCLASESAGRVYQAEFLPDVDDPATAEALWHFIDQTGVFYVQKVVHAKNPFHELAERRNQPVPDDFAERVYQPSHLFVLANPTGGSTDALCDWDTLNYAELPRWVIDAVQRWDPDVSVRANLERLLEPGRRGPMYSTFEQLVASGLFVPARADGGSTSPPPPALFRRGNMPVPGAAGASEQTADLPSAEPRRT